MGRVKEALNSDRIRCRRRWLIPTVAGFGLVLVVGTASMAGGAFDPVTNAFDDFAGRSGEKAGGGSPIPPDHVRTDATDLPDGSRVALWVTDPAEVSPTANRCFFLETRTADGHRGGVGACGMPDNTITLNRLAGVVVGSVGTWPAHSVSVTAGGETASLVPVTGGYFLVPASLFGNVRTKYSISLLDAAGQPVGVVDSVPAPGTAKPAD